MELGKVSSYDVHYNPDRLFAIQRAPNRRDLGINEDLPFFGHDIWNHYEVSWLNLRGKPQVAIATIVYSCTSPNIIESKSLKLYFNSLNNSRYENSEVIEEVVTRDISLCLKAPVSVSIKLLTKNSSQILSGLSAISIDDLDIEINNFQIDPKLLKTGEDIVTETLCSNLLKSNCLVTGQPDWGSLWVSYTGPRISQESLLRYIISFRNHNEFHEHCVERIFVDISKICKPSELTVGARYTRRGGIDINPIRSTLAIPILNHRMIRQ
jgi:7-cyano-7-deazaguanine reductase